MPYRRGAIRYATADIYPTIIPAKSSVKRNANFFNVSCDMLAASAMQVILIPTFFYMCYDSIREEMFVWLFDSIIGIVAFALIFFVWLVAYIFVSHNIGKKTVKPATEETPICIDETEPLPTSEIDNIADVRISAHIEAQSPIQDELSDDLECTMPQPISDSITSMEKQNQEINWLLNDLYWIERLSKLDILIYTKDHNTGKYRKHTRYGRIALLQNPVFISRSYDLINLRTKSVYDEPRYQLLLESQMGETVHFSRDYNNCIVVEDEYGGDLGNLSKSDEKDLISVFNGRPYIAFLTEVPHSERFIYGSVGVVAANHDQFRAGFSWPYVKTVNASENPDCISAITEAKKGRIAQLSLVSDKDGRNRVLVLDGRKRALGYIENEETTQFIIKQFGRHNIPSSKISYVSSDYVCIDLTFPLEESTDELYDTLPP